MNIFVIEDEPPILREIVTIINSFHEDYQVIGTATNGQQAVDFLEENGNQVDVMITDIQIPIKNGLELISYVNQHFSHILSMILTGYGSFDYARSAIQKGVFGYLLKPVDEDELRNELQKAYAQKCMDYMRNQPLDKNEKGNTELESGCQLALISLGFFPIDTITSSDTFSAIWKELDISSLIKEKPEMNDRFWIIDGIAMSEKLILFSPSDQEINDGGKILAEFLKNILTKRPGITIGIDSRFRGIRHIHQSALDLRGFVNSHAKLENSQLLFYDHRQIPPTVSVNKKDYHIISQRLAELFAAKNVSMFNGEFKNYISMMEKQCLSTFQIYQFLQELLQACLQAGDIHSSTSEGTIIGEVLLLSDSYNSLYENMYAIFLTHFESMIKNEEITSDKSAILLKIDSYIKENYTKQINTQSIAEEFRFTPAYLSQIFREYKSITPADYITQLRMEKAKKLLLSNPNCKIKDIATFVGYEDSLYFSKVFKKTTGMSPKQFLDYH